MATVNLKALIQKFDPLCQSSLEAAAGLCLSLTHYNVELEHWLIKLLEINNSDVNIIIKYYGLDKDRLNLDLQNSLQRLKTGNAHAPALSQRIIDLAREALLIATLEFGKENIRSAYLLYALLHEENLQRIAHNLSAQFKKISLDQLSEEIFTILQDSAENHFSLAEEENSTEQLNSKINTKTPALNQFTVNLTELARDGKIDQVIGREQEIRQIIDILSRRRQNNPLLTGEPGVGKTAVVEGFALRVANGEVPETLKNVAVHVLDLGLLQAGAGIKGEFENRLKSVINEVKAAVHPIVLFIDEAHTLIGAGAQAGHGDAANLLKPALARGELRTIAATTWAEYKKYFEQDAALARRFQVIKIEEPDAEKAITMLRGLVANLEQHHNVRILDEAVIAAVKLSQRYLANRQLPDKAISILDTACARLAIRANTQPATIENGIQRIAYIETEMELLQREQVSTAIHKQRLIDLASEHKQQQKQLEALQKRWSQEKAIVAELQQLRTKLEQLHSQNKLAAENKSTHQELEENRKQFQKLLKQLQTIQGEAPLLQDCVNAQTIAEVISAWTGVPLGRMLRDEIQTILDIQAHLERRIIGQPHALNAIAQTIQTSRASLTDPRKPIGVFLFVGPSGVGKTETALALAELLYGGEQNMTVINLSEFKEEHKVSLLLGSPPGYVGYGEGGVLTEAVRRRPYSLLLLDEVEKAHPGVQDIFYQVFDKGMLRDGQGRDIDFKNTIIILTSNVGGELITKLCSDPDTMPDWRCLHEAIKPELLKVFKPAFLGRVAVIPYVGLDDSMIQQIVNLQLQRIQKRIREHHQAQFSYNENLISQIALRCKEVETGARTIDHLLTRGLLPQISTHFLTALAEGKTIKQLHVDLNPAGEYVYQLN